MGNNAYSLGNPLLSEKRITDEMKDLIGELLERKDPKLKLKFKNVGKKVYIHTVSSCVSCAYPLFADHIIDVQCGGAYQRIEAASLAPKGTKHEEIDLLFLDVGVSGFKVF